VCVCVCMCVCVCVNGKTSHSDVIAKEGVGVNKMTSQSTDAVCADGSTSHSDFFSANVWGAMYEHLRVVPPGKRLRVPSCTRPEILGSG